MLVIIDKYWTIDTYNGKFYFINIFKKNNAKYIVYCAVFCY